MERPDAVPTVATAPKRPASLAWVEALAATAPINDAPTRLLPHILAERARETPLAPALLSDRETFTFAALAERIEFYAAWSQSAGLRKGETVALVMSNRPEYVALWLGLSRAGIVTALINTNLAGEALKHCLRLAGPRHIIAEAPYLDRVKAEIGAATLWSHGENAGAIPRIDLTTPSRFTATAAVTIDDRALLIYTSGTTGLPKAAAVSHRRVLNWALWFTGLLGNTAQDRMYNCLPLYHSVGGVVAVAATLAAGGSTVIAEKFSVTRFWSDIQRFDCTQFQYIGELCRYLLNAPVSATERAHHIRVACGNGLREDVWMPFQQRFGIPHIVEFYAATEGSFSLFNAEGKPGAIGRIPPYLRHRFPTALIRLDATSGEPLRDAAGLCIAAATGEPGEAIGRIATRTDAGGSFEGYTDGTATERKILRDVFMAGDAWFRSGDLMRMDAAGYYSFVDRMGDTFRWKGENVSTLEVANVLAKVPGVADVAVYGVPVPGHDGKAGMAFLEVRSEFDLSVLLAHAGAALPAYAVPVFLRVGQSLMMTETFKHKKQELARDGYRPAASADAFYFRPAGSDRYLPLDDHLRGAIESGDIRI